MALSLRLLDLFCGAGGCSMGYHQAGFDVIGVDIAPQPHYPFRFIQADALEYVARHGQEYDVIHASPPCQAYSALKHFATKDHPELILATRAALQETCKPYVIENVVGAPLIWPLMLCGSMFDLQTSCGAQLRRHRLFESNLLLMSPGACQHHGRTLGVHGHEFRNEASRYAERKAISICGDKARDRRTITVVGNSPRDSSLERQKYRTITVNGSTPQQNVVRNRIKETFPISEARRAMGIDWMPMKSLSQAIPPAYTRWIGQQIRVHFAENG